MRLMQEDLRRALLEDAPDASDWRPIFEVVVCGRDMFDGGNECGLIYPNHVRVIDAHPKSNTTSVWRLGIAHDP